MRIFCIFISCLLLFCSCDPFQMVYVRNYSASDVILDVSLNNQYHFSKPVDIASADSLIKDKNDLFGFSFPERLPIKEFNDSIYQVKVNSGSTSLLSPVCMGFPIQKINIKYRDKLDSVIFSGLNHNIKYSKKNKTLQKVSLSTYIIDLRKQ